MNITPAPRFLHVVGVELGEVKVGAIFSVQAAQPMARVLANNSENLKKAGLTEGHIVFFSMTNLNQLAIEEDGPHGILFEDAVLGWADEKSLPAPLKAPMVRIVDPTKPGIVRATDAGVDIRYKRN